MNELSRVGVEGLELMGGGAPNEVVQSRRNVRYRRLNREDTGRAPSNPRHLLGGNGILSALA